MDKIRVVRMKREKCLMLKKKSLRNSLILEYVFILITIVIGYFLFPAMMESATEGNPGLDGLGTALAWVILMRGTRAVLAFLFLLANPIRILIKYRKEFKEIAPCLKKIGVIAVTALPIVLSIFMIFEVAISNLLYSLKYETGKGAYALQEEDYRSPAEFCEELEKRDLLFDDDQDQALLNRLNEKYVIPDQFKDYYYTKGTMMAMSEGCFYDTSKDKVFVTKDSSEKAPYYVYNAILTMPGQSESLQYAPIARYDKQDSVSDVSYPFFQDCYVECKILYVDGSIYAIIGVGQSYDLKPEFQVKEEPAYLILSEKASITTYVDGKYYPYGAIEDQRDTFEMRPNDSARSSVFPNYPVREVERLDLDVINAVAAELREGILKDKIEAHWSK